MGEFQSPGLYLSEKSSGPGPMASVSTSTYATCGWLRKGPENEAILITSFAKFIEKYGTYWRNSYVPIELAAFFQNGGSRAYISRVTPSNATKAVNTTSLSDVATAAEFIGKTLGSTVDLSTNANIKVTVDGTAFTVDCAGVSPAATTPEEIVALLNAAVTSKGIVTLSTSRVKIVSKTTGTTSTVSITSAATEDASDTIFGLDVSDGQTYSFTGEAASSFDLEAKWNGAYYNQVRMSIEGNSDEEDGNGGYNKYDISIEGESGVGEADWETLESYSGVVLNDDTSDYFIEDMINGNTEFCTVAAGATFDAPRVLRPVHQKYEWMGIGTGATDDFGGTLRHYPIHPGSLVASLYTAATAASFTGPTLGSTIDLSTVKNLKITIDGGTAHTVDCSGVTPAATTPAEIAAKISTAITGEGVATVVETSKINIVSYSKGENSSILFSTPTSAEATLVILGLTNAVEHTYTGVSAIVADITDDGEGVLTGTDGAGTIVYTTGVWTLTFEANLASGIQIMADYYETPTSTELNAQLTTGSDGSSAITRGQVSDPALDATKAGIYAFNTVEEVLNISLPDFAGDVSIGNDLISFCETKGNRFTILSAPINTDAEDTAKFVRTTAQYNTSYAALYSPWVKVVDPIANDGRTMLIPPDGFVAGRYAYTDVNRNVGKAPAGIVDGKLNGAVGLERVFDKGERDTLHPARVNVIMSSNSTGIAIWGARTLSKDAEWQYINARRLFMFCEQSVYNSLWWVPFENNGAALWGKIRSQLSGFMTNLFRDNYFAGAQPDEAYRIVCDSTNNIQSEIDAGLVTIDVYIAPNKPAEFVRIRFQQKVKS